MSKNKKPNKGSRHGAKQSRGGQPEDQSSKNSHASLPLMEQIVKTFNKHASKTLNYKQIAGYLKISDPDRRRKISNILDELAFKEVIVERSFGKYALNIVEELLLGEVAAIASGSAFIICEEQEEDVYVHANNLNQALHGDTVKVRVIPGSRKKIEGQVIEVVKRKKTEFIGRVEISAKYAFFIADSQKMNVDFFIPLAKLKGAKEGEKVIAEIADWPKNSKNPFGRIIKVLGEASDNDVVMNSIMFEYELPMEFPDHVEKEADKISVELDKAEIAKRRDFRDITTFTIDPHDAKDFDDALSIKKLDNGNYEIGVHIADVSHYVPEGSILDEEAFNRATSVYLVDRVVPMLPEKLSNGVCSLRPHEEKFCFSAVFEMNENAQVLNEWYGRTTIYSDKRFAYEDAQAIIEGENGPLKPEVLLLDGLAKKLRKERLGKGGLTFDRVEVKFNLDEKGAPTGVYFKESKDANKLIEEFMLLANRSVAAYIGKKSKPKTFVYRIHDKPSPEKFEQFSNFVTKFGYFIKPNNESEIAQSISKLLTDVKGKKESNMLETLAIRTMAKAEYSTENIGHYGLGFTHYSHFTSPIRRYPDVMLHRLLQKYLDGEKSVNANEQEEMCIHSSKQEKLASQAERDSIKYKQVQFMMNKVGQEFEALISGVTEWGMYAEITENLCEGMISIRTMTDDFYSFDQDNFCLVGKKNKEKFQIGDKIIIEIKNADLVKRQLDYLYIKRVE
ncbi:MAG: ribonuclease R [Saprospiraceae bacterium]|jgi:ribonuclease R